VITSTLTAPGFRRGGGPGYLGRADVTRVHANLGRVLSGPADRHTRRAGATRGHHDPRGKLGGHARNPHATDDYARRQIGECRRYIGDFEEALERSSIPAELIDRMTEAYPDLANPYTLWVAAYDQLSTGR